MAEARHTKEDLKMMQALPLDLKVRLTEDRIRAWVHEFGEDGVCVSFSGGKDSTVLLNIVRNLYPNVKAVFSNTGLEYPEIQRFVRGFDNTDIIVPEMSFRDVVTQLGYPLISKEVAEAIHYARKLRWGGGPGSASTRTSTIQSTERTFGIESERRRKDLAGKRYPWDNGGMPEKNGTPGGGQVQTREQQNRGSEWQDWRRGCL